MCFSGKARRGGKGGGRQRAWEEHRRIMKCKNRDKKKMDRYTVEVKWWGETAVLSLCGKNPASCHFLFVGYLEGNHLNEGSAFPGICSSFFLEIDGPAPGACCSPKHLLIGPTVPNLGRGRGWVSTSWREGGCIKHQHVCRQLWIYIKEINNDDDGMGEILQTWSPRQPHDQLHGRNQFGKKNQMSLTGSLVHIKLIVIEAETK